MSVCVCVRESASLCVYMRGRQYYRIVCNNYFKQLLYDTAACTYREAKAKTAGVQTEKVTASTAVRALQTQRTAVTAERTGLEKKLTGEEILIERQRAQLHEVSAVGFD